MIVAECFWLGVILIALGIFLLSIFDSRDDNFAAYAMDTAVKA